jgi:ribonucleoside-diphosphate reductase alpha chain
LQTENKSPFDSAFSEFVYKSRYARWLEEEGRRENWDETVLRLSQYYWTHLREKFNYRPDFPDQGEQGIASVIYNAIYNLEVMPSMRALMTAGPALDRCHVPAYNCAYLPVDSPRSFDECMYILMCGTGVGYSVEQKYIDQLPRISEEFAETDTVITVADSKEGWAKAYRELVSLLIAGQVPKWDVSRVRGAGERLKTFGGRASGPEPLVDLFEFTVKLFTRAAGRRLTSVECHDIMCKIADIVVVGGVRRSAMISLFDCTDDRMSKAKFGAWWNDNPHRALSNNSAVYENRKPDVGFFMNKWTELYESKSGEPGFFSRAACQRIAGRNGRRDATPEFGTNPCSEIILRPFQFCNLAEAVVRSDDDLGSLSRKVRIATILGTIQSTFTDFKYLRKKWQDTCNEERLLGVSFTGICDNLALLGDPEVLANLRNVAIETNKEWAARLGINQSAAITCVKPSGTVSQLVNSASGLHTRHAPYYLRTVRADNKDPITQFLKDQGVYSEPCVMKGDTTTVFYFPIKSPEGALTRHGQNAIQALELWATLQEHWCEHKPSATVNVREEEWPEVGAWVYRNFDTLSGVAFLPYDGGSYKQAPYQEVTEEEYNKWLEDHPPVTVDWSKLKDYETFDTTTGSQELACGAGGCDVTDLIGANISIEKETNDG